MGVLDKKVLGGPLSKFTLSREVLGGGLGGKPCLEVNLHQSAPASVQTCLTWAQGRIKVGQGCDRCS